MSHDGTLITWKIELAYVDFLSIQVYGAVCNEVMAETKNWGDITINIYLF